MPPPFSQSSEEDARPFSNAAWRYYRSILIGLFVAWLHSSVVSLLGHYAVSDLCLQAIVFLDFPVVAYNAYYFPDNIPGANPHSLIYAAMFVITPLAAGAQLLWSATLGCVFALVSHRLIPSKRPPA